MTERPAGGPAPAVQRAVIDVRPTTINIGAEVVGVDLARDLDEATIAALRGALLDWKVLFFREQQLDHARQIALGRRFGELTVGHPMFAMDEAFPEIYTIDRDKQAEGGRYILTEAHFHTDVTPSVNPPAASILRADVVPEFGGDTIWTNLASAYAALPAPLRALADSLRAVHRFPVDETNPRRGVFASNPIVSEHPVVRVHPETGERALFVNPVFTSHIAGFSPRESRRVLDLFFAQITSPEFTVRFRWQAGSVAFWDNRSTAHVGPVDLNYVDVPRRLHRVTIVGDVPVGPDGQPSTSLAGDALGAARAQ